MAGDESEVLTPQAATRRLVGQTTKMAYGTIASRILGFVKAALLVYALGAANPQAETFTYATLVPNTLYMLFAGGALNTVLVPQIVRHIRSDSDGGEAFVNRVVTAILALLAALTFVATVATPWVMSLWTSGTWRTPAWEPHWSMLVLMAFLTMPQLFFFGAFFLIGQVLNARDQFTPLMWAPIVNNLVGIAVLGAFMLTWGTNAAHGEPFTVPQVLLLGIGSTLGIVAQTAALLPAARRIGFRYRPRWDLKGTGLGATFRLGAWMIGYVLVTSVAQILVSRLASNATVAVRDLPGAGMTAYQNAYLIWILPHSLVSVALATVMMPSASRLAASHDFVGMGAELTRTVRLATTFMLPASVGLFVLGTPFVELFFGYGRGTDSWQFIATTLVSFAVGLVPFTLQYLTLRGFFVLEDSRTPFLLQCVISGLNVVVAWVFVTIDPTPMTVAPRLALAYSLAYFVGAWLTHRALKKRLPGLSGMALIRHLWRVLLAVLPGAAIAAAIAWFIREQSRPVMALGLVAAAAVAVLLFFFMAKRLSINEATEVLRMLSRRAPAQVDADAVPAPLPQEPPAPAAAPDAAAVRGADDEVHPLLEYPDHSGTRLDVPIPPGPEAVSNLAAGHLLGRRYRLDQPLSRRGGTLTWLGYDLTLSRTVLLHVMSPTEPRVLDILDEAGVAARVCASPFLQVWDAVLVEDTDQHGSYIVCEYVPGQSLELALRHGTFTDVEAAWVVRELARGLTEMHSKGLYHRQLNPDTVIISATGDVKVVGFLIEAALHPEPDDPTDGEAQDVRALGELLYASLLGRWPGPARYGLPAAPTDYQGRALLPSQISARVSRTLDDIVDRILSPVPRQRASRLTTAQDVEIALTAALGGANASHDLEKRLRFPLAPLRLTAPKSWTTPVPAQDAPSAVPPDAVPPAAVPSAAVSSAAVPAVPQADAPDADGDATQAWFDPFADTDGIPSAVLPAAGDDDTTPLTPIPPPQVPTTSGDLGFLPLGPQQGPRRRWLAVLATTYLVVLLAALGTLFAGEFTRVRAPAPTPGVPHPVAAIRDFDPAPDGGDGRENPDQAGRAIDGDPTTAWHSEVYGRSADFNGRKPGVGLVLDLGERRRVTWITLDFGAGNTVAELRVPLDPTATTPPMTGRAAWRIAQPLGSNTGRVSLKLDSAVETRFVLVYVTRLPERDGRFQASLSQVEVAP